MVALNEPIVPTIGGIVGLFKVCISPYALFEGVYC
jgi:hypothetical protein